MRAEETGYQRHHKHTRNTPEEEEQRRQGTGGGATHLTRAFLMRMAVERLRLGHLFLPPH